MKMLRKSVPSVGWVDRDLEMIPMLTSADGLTTRQRPFLDGMLYEVAIFASILEQEDIEDLMDRGLSSLTAVEASGKLATTWATIKSQ